MLAFKQFREEYEAYLDYLLGDDSLLMKNKLERIDQKYFLKSNLRLLVEAQAAASPQNGALVSRREILKDKLLIELIENPKKLWKHLTIKVRNTWISRVILAKRFKARMAADAELPELEGDAFKAKFAEAVAKAPFTGTYWEVLKGFLLTESKACKNWASLSRSLKSLERNAFKTYFYSFFAVSEVQLAAEKTGSRKATGKGRVKMRSLEEF